jgi:hypothetical protein
MSRQMQELSLKVFESIANSRRCVRRCLEKFAEKKIDALVDVGNSTQKIRAA